MVLDPAPVQTKQAMVSLTYVVILDIYMCKTGLHLTAFQVPFYAEVHDLCIVYSAIFILICLLMKHFFNLGYETHTTVRGTK